MYFTLAISAVTAQACAALVSAAEGTDPRIMPVPGPVRVAWRAPDQRAAVLHWGATHSGAAPAVAAAFHAAPAVAAASHAGTIWADAAGLRARTGPARIDPVYLAETSGAVVISDRACWAAAITRRLGDCDPVMVGAFLSLGYPVGAATPFRRVRALGGDQELRVAGGRAVISRAVPDCSPGGGSLGGGSPGGVAAALADAVRPLGRAGRPVELSLTGGKDSRLVAAALVAAGVPFRARTHGSADHPDVAVAGLIARTLGVEHTVTEPRPAGPAQAPGQDELLTRLRSAVLVSDGMLSAFENVGRPGAPPATQPVQAGGHGGELLRGGYAQTAWRPRTAAAVSAAGLAGSVAGPAVSVARGAELFRRLTTRHLGLLRPAARAAYLASLAPSAAALSRGPLRALDDFYLLNRAGRWSAAARQAYLLRAPLVQPFFDDRVVRAARAVPLSVRLNDQVHREAIALLCPALAGIPLAGPPWKGEPRTREPRTREPRTPPDGTAAPRSATADWRRDYSDQMAGFLREYVLDAGATSRMFDIVRRQAAERMLQPPQADPQAVWALATLATLLSGDWLNARGPVTNQPKAAR